jgi:hypothetical protein
LHVLGVERGGTRAHCSTHQIDALPFPHPSFLLGDVGTVACAAACDKAGPTCTMHLTDASGTCTLYKAYDLKTMAPDSLKYSLCFKTVKQWEEFGSPDKNGMYWCVHGPSAPFATEPPFFGGLARPWPFGCTRVAPG